MTQLIGAVTTLPQPNSPSRLLYAIISPEVYTMAKILDPLLLVRIL